MIHEGFYGWGFREVMRAYEEAIRDGRIVIVQAVPTNATEAEVDVSMLVAAPPELKVSPRAPDRCIERPHKKWPIRR